MDVKDLDRAICEIAAEILHETSRIFSNRICDEVEMLNTEVNREVLKMAELEEAENGDYVISKDGGMICLNTSVLADLCADYLEKKGG